MLYSAILATSITSAKFVGVYPNSDEQNVLWKKIFKSITRVVGSVIVIYVALQGCVPNTLNSKRNINIIKYQKNIILTDIEKNK